MPLLTTANGEGDCHDNHIHVNDDGRKAKMVGDVCPFWCSSTFNGIQLYPVLQPFIIAGNYQTKAVATVTVEKERIAKRKE